MIAAFKALHIAALSIWCAGLVMLPVLMHAYGRGPAIRTQAGYTEFRWLTHYGYIALLTPAAVVAVSAGTVLIFLQEVLDIWMMVKLLAVTGMVLVHAWLGHLVVVAGEGNGAYNLPPVAVALVVVLPLIAVVLWLVLAKPTLEDLVALFPEFMTEPRGNPIPSQFNPI